MFRRLSESVVATQASFEMGDQGEALPRCTFALSGSSLVMQRIFECATCDMTLDSGKGLCHGCMLACHQDHETDMVAFGRAYCDCGHSGCQLAKDSVETAMFCTSKKSGFSVGPDGRIGATGEIGLDFSSQAVLDIFGSPGADETTKTIEAVKSQCKTLVSLSKDTFLLPGDKEPRTPLEHLARAVFNHHTKAVKGGAIDPSKSAAEFWVQYKDRSKEGECSDAGVVMHYDKDECIAEEFSVGVYPQVSTVTYLTTGGAPTIVFENQATDPTGVGLPGALVSGAMAGKHFSFDGRLLHGAPTELLGMVTGSDMGDKRVTFLVNVWIDHFPSQVEPLSEEFVSVLNEAWGAYELAPQFPLSFGVKKSFPIVIVDEKSSAVSLPFVTEAAEDENCLRVDMFAPNEVLNVNGSQSGEEDLSSCELMFPEELQAVLVEYGEDEDEDEDEDEEQDKDE